MGYTLKIGPSGLTDGLDVTWRGIKDDYCVSGLLQGRQESLVVLNQCGGAGQVSGINISRVLLRALSR